MALYYGFKSALENSAKQFSTLDLIIEYDDADVSKVRLKTGNKTGKATYNNLSYLTGEGGSKVVKYEQDTDYKKDELVYLGNILKRADKDFKSDNAQVLLEDAFKTDIANNNLVDIVEEQEVPKCLGSVKTDNTADLPTNPVEGNWVLIEECVNAAPTQAGIGLYSNSSWTILPIPSGTFTFPEPSDDAKLYFRKRDVGATNGQWEAFTTIDGNEVEIQIKSLKDSIDGAKVPKQNELVWDSERNILVIGDGTTNLGSLKPFYENTLTASDITTALGFTPENSANKGQANGYAPLDANGKVPAGNLPDAVTNTYSKTEIDQKDTDTLASATTLVNAEATTARTNENAIRTDLTNHVNDTTIHVTQTDKDNWNAKVDTSDLTNYDNHLSDAVIHVTQADKDKWNGMSTAYYVTNVASLPSTGVNVGSMGYVQVSAAGVTPVVCDQYIYDGTQWLPYDAGQISLQFNWGNIQGKPASTPLSIDNAVTVAHNHANMNVLNKIGQSTAGKFTYDGVEIGAVVVFLDNDNMLPATGEDNVLYVILEDSRVRNYPSISVWKDNAYQPLGRGIQDSAPVVGDMQILQAEYYSVTPDTVQKISVTSNQYFAFMPVEILREIEGLKNQSKEIVDMKESTDYKYDSDLFDITSDSKLKIRIKSKPTNVDTVSDYFYSSVDIDMSSYKDVDSIE